MPTRAQKLRFGIFIVVIAAFLLIILFLFTKEQFLEKKDIYYIAYEDISVSGLEVGSPVKYLGIRVGNIENIRIDPKNINRIIVKVGLEPDTPIKEDARAYIAGIGITGIKMIEISGGSKEAALLKPGTFIPAGTSLTQDITGKAEIMMVKLETILNNLQNFTHETNLSKFIRLMDEATRSFEGINSTIDENRPVLSNTLNRANNTVSRMDTVSVYLEDAIGSLHNILVSDTLQDILVNARDISAKLKEKNFENLITELSEVIDRTNNLLMNINTNMERGTRDFQMSMNHLRSTLQYLNEASYMIQQDPSVLIRGTKIKEMPDEHLDRE